MHMYIYIHIYIFMNVDRYPLQFVLLHQLVVTCLALFRDSTERRSDTS